MLLAVSHPFYPIKAQSPFLELGLGDAALPALSPLTSRGSQKSSAECRRRGAMSLSRLRTSLMLLLLSTCLLASAGSAKGVAGRASERVPGPAGGSSGRFVSPERHACSWQLLLSAPGREAGSELALRCQGPDGARHHCAYRGEPERCADYAARRSHYWKQVLSGLRKKRLPCHDPAPLKARLCAGKKGHRAELRLVPQGFSPARSTALVIRPEPKPWAKGRGRPRGRSLGPSAWAPPPPSMAPKGKPSEEAKAGKRKAASDHDVGLSPGTQPDPDGLEENAKLTETYCAEKWHSLCNFFVNFWNG
ncbi:PREDICTED: fibroblast growth factor-binding protein 3 [Condylura cristata]|uniref:fibroblast growth factor-binding protein 3 n=1 Tax=Condylura cristata TaxID=143302 RepID=UPI00064342C0|nr:PREDICTED: fibroblast growth factor-binding protein 3 [Condylura cristata]